MQVDAELAKEKLASIFEDLAKASRCEDDRLCRCPCGQAELATAETIRNTDLTDCQPQVDGELVKDLRYALQCCEDHGLHIGELKRAIPQVEALLEKAKTDE